VRVLVTGAFGYLGGRLIEALKQDTILGARYVPAWAARRYAGREIRVLDVLSTKQAEKAVVGVDAVVHLASLDENEAARDPDLAVRVSGEGTRRLLAACRAAEVKRFVYLSTFHVYGPDAASPLDENAPLRPVHPYAIARLTGEGYCYENNRRTGSTRAIVLRMSNGYGAPVDAAVDRWTLAHNDFCRQAFSTSRIVLKTSGVQHRDMVAVDDVEQAIDLVLEREGLEDDVFHVGGGTSLSMLDLADRVRSRAEQRLGRPVVIEHPPAGEEIGEPVQFSIARIQALGFVCHDAVDAETDRIFELLASENRYR
jgi:UDP-glucose 4-epimerase